jgi:hypothetical protein
VPDPLLIHQDLVEFLVTWYRAWLNARTEPICQNVTVTDKEPSGPFTEKLLVIRDDGGPETSILTGERSVGLSVLAGTKDNPKHAMDLARFVHAARLQLPFTDPANPVAALLGSNGPYLVAESQPVARAYLTLDLAVAASLT